MTTQAGDLRHRIRIVKISYAPDGEGNMIPSDSEVCTCWAAAKDAGINEFYSAAARQLDDVVNFTIRWREGLAPGMVIIHAGARHEIVQVSRLSHLRDFMVIKTNRRSVIA